MSLSTELEVLTGKLIRGDITPIVYELVKDSAFLSDIATYSTREVITKYDNADRYSYTSNVDCGTGFVLKDWLRDNVQSLPAKGERKHIARRKNDRPTSTAPF